MIQYSTSMSVSTLEQEVSRSQANTGEVFLPLTRRSETYGEIPTPADYAAARDELSENLQRLACTNTFSTSETVTPHIAKQQGEAWLAYLDRKAKGS